MRFGGNATEFLTVSNPDAATYGNCIRGERTDNLERSIEHWACAHAAFAAALEAGADLLAAFARRHAAATAPARPLG